MSVIQQQVADPLPDVERVYLSDMAARLERKAHTVRRWVRDAESIHELAGALPDGKGYLPLDLWPQREDGGLRMIFWAPEQVEPMREYSAMKAGRAGWQSGRRSEG